MPNNAAVCLNLSKSALEYKKDKLMALNYKLFAFVLSLIVLSASPSEASDTPEYKVKPKNFFESLPDVQKISLENAIVGYHFGDLNEKISRPALLLTGIKLTDKNICIRVENRSGTYIAQANIKNPKLGSTIRVKLPTKKKSIYRATASDLAIVAKVSPNRECEGEAEFLTTSWNGMPKLKDSFNIFANLNGHDSAKIALQGTKNVADCLPVDMVIKDSNKTFRAFNYVCSLKPESCKSETLFALTVVSNGHLKGPNLILRRNCL